MNPLAQLMRARGHAVQGSDRSFDQGKNLEVADRLTALGIVVKPQDGCAVSPNLDRFVYSTAVEAETPEVRAARAYGIERVPRPALLAEVVDAGRPGVAIAGTSGKSTITGMVGWLTREAGLAATVLGGAALAGEGGAGCFLPGAADGPVAAEACESDGTLTGYHAALGLIHNISRDHGEVEALLPQFETFAKRCGRLLVNAASPEAAEVGRAARALPGGRPPLRGDRGHRGRRPGGGRLRPQWREAPRRDHHRAVRVGPGARRLPAARLRAGALPAPRAARDDAAPAAGSGPPLLRGDLLRGRHRRPRRVEPHARGGPPGRDALRLRARPSRGRRLAPRPGSVRGHRAHHGRARSRTAGLGPGRGRRAAVARSAPRLPLAHADLKSL